MEAGRVQQSDLGTPQGGVISPLLANIYLHHALDLWVEHDVRPKMRSGRVKLIRYADDFVILFEREDDARRVMAVLGKRLGRFGLALHPDKTRLLSFDSPGLARLRAQRARSFDFLGLTHYWARSRKGRWVVKQRTAKDRVSRVLKRLKARCRRMMHDPLAEQHRCLSVMLRGHYNYFGITGNGDALWSIRGHAERIWGKTLARRNKRRFAWERFKPVLERWPLPPAYAVRSVCPSEPLH